MKFNEWFEQYFEVYCKGTLSYDKQREYRYIYQKHFYPIAETELEDIKPIDIQMCINTTKGYCYQRRRDTFFLVRRALEEAIFNGYLQNNPARYLKAPKKIKKYAETFSAEELQMLFDSNTRLSRMFLFELWTGLRRGELLALTWDNINLEKKTMWVCNTLVRAENGDEICNTTKSRRDRIVPLSDTAIAILLEIREKDTQEGLVFVTERGKPITLRNYTKLYRKYFAQQQEKHPKLKYLSGHKLRHSYATYMLYSGADIESLRALLGHVDIATTQRYIHSNFEQMRIATDKLRFS
ncbi:MAG: tyrosine-type recombinase/integrase [Oscillospiraceae bacterium]|nr:tyrosine-type recombinase/integrase [Oscillospiraceae bacterium]